ncbi:MAG: TetR/AcrR family transcriptional regulator [Leptospirales bacterium]|nr:TetR/AcrR family transcriptional regulator [Leptospirales bacterium]
MQKENGRKLVRAKYTKGEATLEKIRDACLDEIINRGYHHTSVCEIVRRAQLTRGAFYNYWVSLDHCISDLLLVIREIVADDKELMRYQNSLSDESALVRKVRGILYYVRERQMRYPLLPLSLLNEKDLNNDELQTILIDYCAQVQGEYHAAIQADEESGLLKSGVDSAASAVTVMLFLRGLLEVNVVRPPSLLENLEKGFAAYLGGLFSDEYLQRCPIGSLAQPALALQEA